MKTDLYTKVVLTVIAVALCVIVFQNTQLVTTAQAAPPPVNITAPAPQATKSEVIDVNIVRVGGYSVYGSSGIPTYIKK